MTILSHLRHKNSWISSFIFCKSLKFSKSFLIFTLTLIACFFSGLFTIGTSDYRILSNISLIDFFEGIADFSYGRPLLGSLDS